MTPIYDTLINTRVRGINFFVVSSSFSNNYLILNISTLKKFGLVSIEDTRMGCKVTVNDKREFLKRLRMWETLK